MKTSNLIIAFVVIALLIGSVVTILTLSNQESVDEVPYSVDSEANDIDISGMESDIDEDRKNVTNTVLREVEEMVFTHEGSLLDVSGGASSGVAMARYQDGEYLLKVEFANLPPLEEGFFYEGWIVRRGENMSVISTGVINELNGLQQNIYRSTQNLLDHDFYVLTLEPDDGDPAPDKHINEGVLTQVREAVAATPESTDREGQYTDYDPARLADASDGKVVLFFHASWCPTCQIAEREIQAKADDIPNGLTILKTDFDEYDDLKTQYGVTYQHTFVEVDADGNKLQIWNGGSLDEILRRLGLN